MATIKKPIVLMTDGLDMPLVHLLESKYTIIVRQENDKICIELYEKTKNADL